MFPHISVISLAGRKSRCTGCPSFASFDASASVKSELGSLAASATLSCLGLAVGFAAVALRTWIVGAVVDHKLTAQHAASHAPIGELAESAADTWTDRTPELAAGAVVVPAAWSSSTFGERMASSGLRNQMPRDMRMDSAVVVPCTGSASCVPPAPASLPPFVFGQLQLAPFGPASPP